MSTTIQNKKLSIASVSQVSFLGQISQKKLVAYVVGVVASVMFFSGQPAVAASYQYAVDNVQAAKAKPGSLSQYLKSTSREETRAGASGDNNAVPLEDNNRQDYVVYVVGTVSPSAVAPMPSSVYPLYFD